MTSGFIKAEGISSLSEQLLVFQEVLCSMQFETKLFKLQRITLALKLSGIQSESSFATYV
jgi:hypothetical protein